MQKTTIQLETLVCPSCSMKIESAVKSLPGVNKDSVKVSFSTSKVKLDFDSTSLTIETIEKAITALGYVVIKSQVKPQ